MEATHARTGPRRQTEGPSRAIQSDKTAFCTLEALRPPVNSFSYHSRAHWHHGGSISGHRVEAVAAFTVLAGATGYFVCQIIAMLFDWQVAAMVLLAVGIATMVAAAVDSGRR
jgi:hypothetical protein